ncbi:MAG: di-heme enzyme, partial [Deltaproteobacteria bacterium]|nr:di-heme enzyme [Deltaproteobacteria bacterium]
MRLLPYVLVAALAAATGCADEPRGGTPYSWELPPGVPPPPVPDSNPMTVEKVELGRYLFYDNRLSINQQQSCGSCHEQALGFADGRVTPFGTTGEPVPRNSMGLANVAYSPHLTWANHLLTSIEDQVMIPLFGESPIEMGMVDREKMLLERLAADPLYQELFASAFPGDSDPFTVGNLVRALSSFIRSMTSFDAPVDRYSLLGDKGAMSPAAVRGMNLFLGERLECHHCHGGVGFSRAFVTESSRFSLRAFDNNGLYNLGNTGMYPEGGRGLYDVTGDPLDLGMFRPPTLRNIAVTGPYMHDGSISSLDAVIDIYAAGGQVIEDGELAGDGRIHPNKSGFVIGFELSAEERQDLLEFMDAL